MKTYDCDSEMCRLGGRKCSEYMGEVFALEKIDPKNADTWKLIKFTLRRIYASGRFGIYVKFMPHDQAKTEAYVYLSRHQARWMIDALEAAIVDYDAWIAKKVAARERAKTRKAAKSPAPPPDGGAS